MLATLAMISICVSALGQSTGTLVLQREAPPQLPIGDWRTVDVGGGFTFEYFFAWKPFEYVPLDHEVFPWDICSFQCRVKVHEKHADCDFSCDEPCTTEHKKTIDPIWESNLGNLYSWLADTFRALNNTKIPWSFTSRGTGSVDAVMADFQANIISPATTGSYGSEARQVYDGNHQKEACGRVRFRYQMGRSTLVMKYRLSDAGGKLGEGEYSPAGFVYAPLPNQPRQELEYGSGPCLCEPSSTGQTSHLFVPSGSGLQPPGVWIDEGNTGKYVLASAAVMSRHGVQIACPDMSRFVISAAHPTMPVNVLVTPGAVVKPLDPAFQDLLLSSRVLASFSPLQNLFAATRTTNLASPPVEGKAACLDMNKQMPTNSTQFRTAIPSDGRHAHLGRVGSEQPVSGPWDQARVWIYTEGATLEKINKKLLLGVTTTQYVNELYNLDKKVGVDLRKPKYQGCWTPTLLLGESGPAAPIGWFASQIAARDPEGVSEFLTSRHADFGKLFADLSVARQRLHTIALFNGLLSSQDARIQLAALNLLNEHADAKALNVLMSNRGLGWAGRLMRSQDLAVAQASLTLFERLGHPYALSFMPKAGSSHSSLRPRFLALAKKLESLAKA